MTDLKDPADMSQEEHDYWEEQCLMLEAKDCLVRAKLDEPKVERQLNWICPSCCMGFDVMPEKCPINANGCDDLLAKGK